MRIGEVAKKSGVGIQTIRFYERRGLLREPPRNASGYRSYDPSDVERIVFIKWCKPLGFTLKEVRELIQLHGAVANLRDDPEPGARNNLQKIIRMAEEKSASVQNKIALLRDAVHQLNLTIKKLQSAAGPVCPGAMAQKN